MGESARLETPLRERFYRRTIERPVSGTATNYNLSDAASLNLRPQQEHACPRYMTLERIRGILGVRRVCDEAGNILRRRDDDIGRCERLTDDEP